MRRKYSDRERAEALAMHDAGESLRKIQEVTGIPDSTLSAWINHNQGMNDDIPDLRTFKKLDLASKLDAIAHQCAGLLPDRLPEANVREIVGAMAQSIEKGQLLRGDPTNISASNSRNSQLNTAKQSYILTALPDLQHLHPDWSNTDLQRAAEQKFNDWYASLTADTLASDAVQ